MSVYLQRQWLEEGEEARFWEDCFEREGFVLVDGGEYLRCKLEGEEARRKEREQMVYGKMIMQLLREYLGENQRQFSVQGLTPEVFGEAERKSFVKYVKERSTRLESQLHAKQVLAFQPLKSLSSLIKLKYIYQSQQLLDLLHHLQQKHKAMTETLTKKSSVDLKKLQVYDVLLTNCELRTTALTTTTSNLPSSFRSGLPRHMSKLKEDLKDLREKEQLMKKIVENGGWGLLTKIRQRVSQLKQ